LNNIKLQLKRRQKKERDDRRIKKCICDMSREVKGEVVDMIELKNMSLEIWKSQIID